MQLRRSEEYDAVGEDTAGEDKRCSACWEETPRLVVNGEPHCVECAREAAARMEGNARLSLELLIGAVEHQLRLTEAAQAARQAAAANSMARLRVLDAAEQWTRVHGTEEEAPRAEKLRAEVTGMQQTERESFEADVALRRMRAGVA